jgi:hypothetical protein
MASAIILFRHLARADWPADEAGPVAVVVAEVKSWRDAVRLAGGVASGHTAAALGFGGQPPRQVVVVSPPSAVVPALLFPSAMDEIPWVKSAHVGVAQAYGWDALVVWPSRGFFPQASLEVAAQRLLAGFFGGGAVIEGIEQVPAPADVRTAPRELNTDAGGRPVEPVVLLMREARRIIAVCHHSKRIPTHGEMVRLRQLEQEIADLRRASGGPGGPA